MKNYLSQKFLSLLGELDEDEDILAVVRERLKKPSKRIRVNIDDL